MDTSKLSLEECSGGSLEADHLCVLVHGVSLHLLIRGDISLADTQFANSYGATPTT